MELGFSFISGVNVGIEFFTGDDLHEGDKFAMVINLGICRLMFIVLE
jgi:hypothetical protein